MTPDDALEAAKLAAMVGGQLKTIDQYATQRGSNPLANKIDINSFVAQVKDPRRKAPPARYLTEVPAGFAEPLPEDYVQNQIPDVVPQYISPSSEPEYGAIQPPLPPVNNPAPPADSVNLPHLVKSVKPIYSTPIIEGVHNSVLTRSDVDSIRNSLKNIDKSLSGMLTLLKNSKITSNE